MIGTAEKIIVYMMEQIKKNPTKRFKLDDYHEKRSLKANNYMWELLGKLCEKMKLEPIEEYRKRVKELGIYKQWEIEEKNYNTFKIIWEKQGLAWFCEIVDTKYEKGQKKLVVNTYYGSSSFNSKQMARLIDGIVQDCKAIGIETKSDKEISSMLEEKK